MLRSEFLGRVLRAIVFAARGVAIAVLAIAVTTGVVWLSGVLAPELIVLGAALLACAVYGFATYSPPEEDRAVEQADLRMPSLKATLPQPPADAVIYDSEREPDASRTYWVMLDANFYVRSVGDFTDQPADWRNANLPHQIRVPNFHAYRLREVMNATDGAGPMWRQRQAGEPLAGMLTCDAGNARPISTGETIDQYLAHHAATAD